MIDLTEKKLCIGPCRTKKYLLEFKIFSSGKASNYCKECRAKQAEISWRRSIRIPLNESKNNEY